MKKPITSLSIATNVALLTALLWMRAEHQEELLGVSKAAMRGDELHLGLHASSLKALEGVDAEKATETAELLRTVIAAGDRNTELRERLGLRD